MNRKQERKEVFYLIFESNFHKELTVDELFERAAEYRGLALTDYIKKSVENVFENKEEADTLIEKYLKNWKLQRLSAVTVSILRISVCEMLYNDEVPESITINEAVELAKEFDSDDMPSFINGVLGNIFRNEKKSEG